MSGGGGGGCNILEIFCKRKSKEIAVFDIEDKATTEAAATADGLWSQHVQGCNLIDIFCP